MKQGIIITSVIALALIVGGARAGGTALAQDEMGTSSKSDNTNVPAKRKGNAFGNALKSPFKALGRLFGGGKGNKLQRLSEKDVKKFESVGAVRIVDARTPVAESPTPTAPTAAAAAGDLLSRGRHLLGQGYLNDAIATLSQAVSADQKLGEAYNLLGIAYDRKGMPRLAADSFKQALRATPKDAQALNNYGYLLYRVGEYEQAVNQLKRAAKISPADQRVWNNLALAQCGLGKYDEAYKSFARAGGEFKARMNIAGMLTRADRNEDALEHYEAARRLQPASPLVARHLVELYRRTGRASQAEETLRSLNASKGVEVTSLKGDSN